MERHLRRAPRPSAADVLGGLIDLYAGSDPVVALFGNDPSVIEAYAERHELQQKMQQILGALAGSRPSTAKLIRARAAMAAAKEGTAAALAIDGQLTAAARGEILAAALRALRPRGATGA